MKLSIALPFKAVATGRGIAEHGSSRGRHGSSRGEHAGWQLHAAAPAAAFGWGGVCRRRTDEVWGGVCGVLTHGGGGGGGV